MCKTLRNKATPQGQHTSPPDPPQRLLLALTNNGDHIRNALKPAEAAGSQSVPKARLALTTRTNQVAPSLPIVPVSASSSTILSAAESGTCRARGQPRDRYAWTIPEMIVPLPPEARIAAVPACSWMVAHPSPRPRRIEGLFGNRDFST